MTTGRTAQTTATAVGAHVEALNLAGVSFAARRLLGKDPTVVTGQFAMWAKSGSGALPSLTAPMWDALTPLRIGRPASTNAAVCDMVLVGREPDAAIARQAAADGAAEGKTMFGRAPLPELQEAAQLAAAIKAYWRVLATVYDEVRGHVVQGDQDGAIGAMRGHAPALRAQLKAVKAQVAAIAVMNGSDEAVVPPDPHQVVVTAGELQQVDQAAAAPAEVQEPPADPQEAVPSEQPAPVGADGAPDVQTLAEDPAPTGPLPAGGMAGETPVRSTIDPVPSGSLRLTDQQAEAFARREALSATQDTDAPAPRKVEVLSSKPVRNHPFLPILFLVIVSGAALYVLFTIINDPSNPLLQ